MASRKPEDASANKTRPADENSAPGKATEPSKQSTASISSRVAASAAGLARDLVGRAGSSAAASGATSSLAESSAGSSASGSKSSLPRTSTAGPAGQEAWIGARGQSSANGSASFREDRWRAGEGPSTQDEFDRFEDLNGLAAQSLDSRNYDATLDEGWEQSNEATRESQLGGAQLGGAQLADGWREEFLDGQHAAGKKRLKARAASELPLPAGHDVLTAQQQDGQEVVAILNDASAGTGMQDFEAELHDSHEASADDLFGTHSAPADHAESISRYKSRLPPAPTHRPASPGNAGNLRPDVRALDDAVAPASREGWQRVEAQWLDAWQDVLERYADDVWGPDLPAVRGAREDIRSLKERDGGAVGDAGSAAALRRLRAVLAHLKLPDEQLRPGDGLVVQRQYGQGS